MRPDGRTPGEEDRRRINDITASTSLSKHNPKMEGLVVFLQSVFFTRLSASDGNPSIFIPSTRLRADRIAQSPAIPSGH